jgi:hypothetical protein
LHSKACSISEHNILHPLLALGRIDYQPGIGVAFHPAKPAATVCDSLSHGSDRTSVMRLDPLESLAALTAHIPDKGQHLVRT